jgi:hypothetical protein
MRCVRFTQRRCPARLQLLDSVNRVAPPAYLMSAGRSFSHNASGQFPDLTGGGIFQPLPALARYGLRRRRQVQKVGWAAWPFARPSNVERHLFWICYPTHILSGYYCTSLYSAKRASLQPIIFSRLEKPAHNKTTQPDCTSYLMGRWTHNIFR